MIKIKVISNKIIIIYTIYHIFSTINSHRHCLGFIKKLTDLQCILYIFLLIWCYEAVICSITGIPSGQKHKHNKKWSQVVPIDDLGDKMCAYSYQERININRQRVRSSAQNRTRLRKM